MKKIIVANWKMNPQTLKEAENLFNEIKKTVADLKNVETIVCPPFIYISNLKSQISQSKVGPPQAENLKMGAEGLFWEDKGAYTGEISAGMIKNLDVEYVIIGHSEERKDHPEETNKIINKKIIKALENNLKVILCIGEKERDEKGEYLDFIKEQILEGLKDIEIKEYKNIIIAYEPIWAIGEKAVRSDKPEDTYNIVVFIRKILSSDVPILYGGSVNVDNAKNFLKNGGVQGLLVGRSSLDGKIFSKILKDADI